MNTPQLPVPPNAILVVEVGSTAHGTGLPGHEDHDETMVVLETAAQVFRGNGLKNSMQRTKPEGERSGPGDVDRNVYSLRAFTGLALKGNPSVLQCLWSPVLFQERDGMQLRDIRESFISQRMLEPYKGYMKSQALRLLGLAGKSNHGRRGSGGRQELIEAHGYDTKYAMHCLRLGYQCRELLTTGGLIMPLPEGNPAGDTLRSIRRGEVPFTEFFQEAVEVYEELGQLANNVPPEPDYAEIDALLEEVHIRAWRKF